MSIFHWLRGNDGEIELSPALRKRLDELDEQNRETQKALRTLEIDWSEWFNKFRLLYARLSKRIRDAAAVEPDENGTQSHEDAPGTTNATAVGYNGLPRIMKPPGGGNYGG